MSNNPNMLGAQVKCPDCGTMSPTVGRTGSGQFFYCSSCGITRFFYDFRCPVCRFSNRMFEKPKLNNCYECSNCRIIVVFTEIIDTPTQFNVKYKWYSGKDKDVIVDKFRRANRR